MIRKGLDNKISETLQNCFGKKLQSLRSFNVAVVKARRTF